MSMCEMLLKMPWWYVLVIVVFSLFYAIRGVMEKMIIFAQSKYTKAQKVIIEYIQEVLFKVIFTVSGFMALYIACHIFSSLKSPNDIGAGTAVLLVFLFVWGIAGVSGYLTFLILSGIFPGLKGNNR